MAVGKSWGWTATNGGLKPTLEGTTSPKAVPMTKLLISSVPSLAALRKPKPQVEVLVLPPRPIAPFPVTTSVEEESVSAAGVAGLVVTHMVEMPVERT